MSPFPCGVAQMAIEEVESEIVLDLPVDLSLCHLEGRLSQADFTMYSVARELEQQLCMRMNSSDSNNLVSWLILPGAYSAVSV